MLSNNKENHSPYNGTFDSFENDEVQGRYPMYAVSDKKDIGDVVVAHQDDNLLKGLDGSFGAVFSGVFYSMCDDEEKKASEVEEGESDEDNGVQVVIKKPLITDESRGAEYDLAWEMMLYGKLSSDYVVKMLGYISFSDGLFGMVTEYCNQKDLFDWISHNTESELGIRLSILKNLSNGLRYIHDHNIAHRDFKTTNIFIHEVGGVLIPKIGDFGLAFELSENGKWIMARRSSERYGFCVDAETIVGDENPDQPNDIASFALIILAIVFRRPDLSEISKSLCRLYRNGEVEKKHFTPKKTMSTYLKYASKGCEKYHFEESGLFQLFRSCLAPREDRYDAAWVQDTMEEMTPETALVISS
ncbi:MAG: protein kinase family protein [Gammaproteobacteria bacterium]